ncbi:hypothetical protein [Roseisolibacter sp. H3M3-2]|uniref:hypothetical protein n=1 Tax=Roseisolibacter sp. H3M3-2 TaxID=3031323 RepID=UPI0023DCE24A|nr:hypothetical protein [Roseisolibacter sp. H3M3-2]MDF1503424.1 hypothetical protein [Roseisolibacter sp. H3M3-2]
MHLVQLLLPLRDNDGRPFPPGAHRRVRETLTARFGGLTAFTRAPAEGEWAPDGAAPARDDVVVLEVMDDALDADWWGAYRRELERAFAQDEIVVRALPIRRL